MVIGDDEALHPSAGPYDRRVAGVVSGGGAYKPALLLDRRASSRPRSAVALVGKVCCKVDAQHEPINVGDLLTTSPTPGHAMRASDQAPCLRRRDREGAATSHERPGAHRDPCRPAIGGAPLLAARADS